MTQGHQLDGEYVLLWAKDGVTEWLICATEVISRVSGCNLDDNGIPWSKRRHEGGQRQPRAACQPRAAHVR